MSLGLFIIAIWFKDAVRGEFADYVRVSVSVQTASDGSMLEGNATLVLLVYIPISKLTAEDQGSVYWLYTALVDKIRGGLEFACLRCTAGLLL